MTTIADYQIGQRLCHHSGAVFEVIERGLPDEAFQGYYRVRCVVGTKRPGWIGGEEEGRVTRGSWLRCWAMLPERSELGMTDLRRGLLVVAPATEAQARGAQSESARMSA